MKKLIAILAITIVLVGAVFATTNTQTLTVQTEVEEVKPAFKLYGNLSNDASTRIAADHTFTATTNTILENDIVLYCWIAQTAACKYQGSVAITVSATALANTTTWGTYQAGDFSVSPTISTITALNKLTSTRTGADGDIRVSAVSGNTVTPTYATGLTAAAGDIASFYVTWASTDLPPASYEATVTTTYTAP